MSDFFDSEKKMQEWLSDKFNQDISLAELLVNIDEFNRYKANTIEEKKIYNSFLHCLKSLDMTEVISEDINISLKYGDSLKPDFLLYAPETETIVIVELKNQKNATREAGTEIGAYANEIKSYIPFISDGDAIGVIISSDWPPLIKHYIFHEIFWLQRNLICLSPININEEVKLKIIEINSIIDSDVSFKIGYNHLGGYQLCLYDYGLYKENNNPNRLDYHLEQMKTAINAMATKGNMFRSHGFAFLWKDHWDYSSAPYSITIINFASFQSIERFFHDKNFEPNDITKKFINIIQNHDPQGHGEALTEITQAGINFLEEFCEPRMEGFHTWDILKGFMSNRSELISFHPWGVFEEIFTEKLLEEYKKGNYNISYDNPNLGMDLLNEFIDPNYDFLYLYDYDV